MTRRQAEAHLLRMSNRYRARAANLRENAKLTTPVTSALQVEAAKRDQSLATLLYPMNPQLAKEFPDG